MKFRQIIKKNIIPGQESCRMRCVQKTTELLAKIMKSSPVADKNIAEKMIVKNCL